jgi:hypothetical protein
MNLLSSIPGQYIGMALNTLPDPKTAPEEYQEAVIDVPGVGRMRFNCQWHRHKRGKFTHYFWIAIEAVRCD